MNLRRSLLFTITRLRGQHLGKYYQQYLDEFQTGIHRDTAKQALINLLQHCDQNVPYYSKIMKQIEGSFIDNPFEFLKHFPILTKDTLRHRFEELKSVDLHQRKWYLNSSGGSTGEPVQFIQDWEYASKAGAVKLLFSKLVGKEIGEREIRLWGNIHDIVSNTEGWKAQFLNKLENATFVNSQLLTPQRMKEYVTILNRSKAKLIVAYADSIYAIAKFAELEGLYVAPQSAIITSAFLLYPFMRSTIEEVFQCKVYDRYGSREFGDIACERPGLDGMWVAPWGNYIEIVDPDGNQLPNGSEGEILVTSLRNYAMPLIRYKIGDRGTLHSSSYQSSSKGQVLKELTGRSMDLFKTQDGTLIVPGFFMANLYFRDWITRYQVIQKDYQKVLYRMVTATDPPEIELDEIIAFTKKAMGTGCEVSFEFVDEIKPSPSGKFRFMISKVG